MQVEDLEFETAVDDGQDEVGGSSSNVSEDLIAEAWRTYDEEGHEQMVARAAETDLIQRVEPVHVSPKPTERVTPVRSAGSSKSPKRPGGGASGTLSSQQPQRRTPTAPTGSSESGVSPSVRASSVSNRNVSESGSESPVLKDKPSSPGSGKRSSGAAETRALTSPGGGRAAVRSVRTPQKEVEEVVESPKVAAPKKHDDVVASEELLPRVATAAAVVVHELNDVGLLPALSALQEALSEPSEEGGYITKLLGSGTATKHGEEGRGEVSVLSTFRANEGDEHSYMTMHGVLRDVNGPVKALWVVTEKFGALVEAEAMQMQGLGEVQERVESIEKKQREFEMQQRALANGVEELGEKVDGQGNEQKELRETIETHEREEMEGELADEQEVARADILPKRSKSGIGKWRAGMILGMVIVLVWAMLNSGVVPRYSRGGIYGIFGHGLLVSDVEVITHSLMNS
ncbi:hypothetical protein BJ742DRAFT_797845 [Cladochytrium replicatum]|nr:hypothetical protein BJ742DRAFT_797845 [Cladochytrium replicatum]